jgi:hypothetical protein
MSCAETMMKKIILFMLLLSTQLSMAEDKAKEEDAEDANLTILLESTFVGDKENPTVSYFIPWKGNNTPNKLQWNIEEKHDQTLQIVDRDVLVTSMNIYNETNLETNDLTAQQPIK